MPQIQDVADFERDWDWCSRVIVHIDVMTAILQILEQLQDYCVCHTTVVGIQESAIFCVYTMQLILEGAIVMNIIILDP